MVCDLVGDFVAKVIKPLTATAVKAATPENSPLRDGGGLYLEISSASKRWRFNYYKPYTKRRTDISLGIWPAMSLQDARLLRDKYRALLDQNIDPQDYLKNLEQERISAHLNTFEKIAETWKVNFKAKKVMSKTMFDDWRRLQKYILPKIGNVPISNVNAKLLVDVLQPVAKAGLTSVIEKVLRTVVSIMDFAENMGIIEMHNCHKAKKSFHIKTAKNNPTIEPHELQSFITDIKNSPIQARTLYLIYWQLLTAVRPAEAVSVEWTEIDFGNKVWHIPAEKMKGRLGYKRPHSVPLSRQALSVLEQMLYFKNSSKYVFYSRSDGNKTMNSETVNVALKRNGYKDKLTAHGMRALVRTYLAQQGVDTNVAETVLAHDIRNKLEKVYNRHDYLEERVAVMQMWGDYVEMCGFEI